MLMLALAPSTSSDCLLAHFDDKNNTKMLFSSCFATSSVASPTSSDDSGFFDDEFTSVNSIGVEIGAKLTTMCDDFDAELLSFRSHSTSSSRSLLDRVFDFFAF